MTTVTETPSGARGALRTQVIRFAGVGVMSTIVHLGLFAALLSTGVVSQLANGVALVVATVANTAANRRWTFGISGRERVVAHHGQALLVFAITWLATSIALWSLGALVPGAGTTAQTLVVAVANAVSTVARFVAMRVWIFTREPA